MAENAFFSFQSTDDSQDRITHLLKQFESPLPMSLSNNWAPPVAVVDVSSLYDYDSVLTVVDQVSKYVTSYSCLALDLKSTKFSQFRFYERVFILGFENRFVVC